MFLGSGCRNTGDGSTFTERGNSERGKGGGWDIMGGILCLFIPSAFEVAKENFQAGIIK